MKKAKSGMCIDYALSQRKDRDVIRRTQLGSIYHERRFVIFFIFRFVRRITVLQYVIAKRPAERTCSLSEYEIILHYIHSSYRMAQDSALIILERIPHERIR